LRTENKLNQVNRFLNNSSHEIIKNKLNFKLNLSQDLNNHWLVGFSDADASFQIKILKRINRKNPEIRLSFQIDQKKDFLLKLIKNFLGGNIGYRKTQDTYYYSSTSFGSARNVIHFFDKYHLLSSKHVNYLKWRKVYIIIQNRQHLNPLGIKKIIKIKNSMNSFSNEKLEL